MPICALCLWIGVMPQPLLDMIRPDVDAVVAVYEQYLAALGTCRRQSRLPPSDTQCTSITRDSVVESTTNL